VRPSELRFVPRLSMGRALSRHLAGHLQFKFLTCTMQFGCSIVYILWSLFDTLIARAW
jgi:hypothetical protein